MASSCLPPSLRSPHPRATQVVNLDMAAMYGPVGVSDMAAMYGPVAGRSGRDVRARPGRDVRATLAAMYGPGFCFFCPLIGPSFRCRKPAE
jgi:hypothetical protein